MDKQQFIKLTLDAEATMFHVAFSILRQEQDCSDAVQEAVTKAYTRRDTLKNPAYFKTWIIRILLNECYALLRRQKRQVPMEEKLMDSRAELCTYIKEEYLDLYQAIQALKEKERICVLLYYIEDYPVREISRILDIPEGTVKSRLRKARMQLKDLLSD